jgi:hypothetical protein
VFPYWVAHEAYENGYYVIASADPLAYDDESVKMLTATNPEIGRSLQRFDFDDSVEVGPEKFIEYFDDPQHICTDNHPLLEYALSSDVELILNSNE